MKRSSSSRGPSRVSQREVQHPGDASEDAPRDISSGDEPRSGRARFESSLRYEHERQHWPRRHASSDTAHEERFRGASSRGEGDEEEALGQARLQTARRRRAKQKVRATTLLFVVPTVAFSLVLMALAHVVFADWRRYNSEEAIARAQLVALEEQLDNGKRRLAVLRSDKGREQLLVEHGFLKPGDRILLFPSEPGQDVPAPIAKNDLAPRRAAMRDENAGSAWNRASRSVRLWLDSLRASARPIAPPAQNAASPANSSPAEATQSAATQSADTQSADTQSAPSTDAPASSSELSTETPASP